MKKFYCVLLLSLILIISGCNNTNTTNTKHNIEDSENQIEDKENKKFEENLEELLIDSYEKENIKEYRHVNDLLSESLTNKLNENLEDNTTEFFETREVKDFELFKSEDTSNKYIYFIILTTTDKDTENRVDTEHYGIVYLINENNKKKIDYLMEIDTRERE